MTVLWLLLSIIYKLVIAGCLVSAVVALIAAVRARRYFIAFGETLVAGLLGMYLSSLL